jgi:hypothetical protein
MNAPDGRARPELEGVPATRESLVQSGIRALPLAGAHPHPGDRHPIAKKLVLTLRDTDKLTCFQ